MRFHISNNFCSTNFYVGILVFLVQKGKKVIFRKIFCLLKIWAFRKFGFQHYNFQYFIEIWFLYYFSTRKTKNCILLHSCSAMYRTFTQQKYVSILVVLQPGLVTNIAKTDLHNFLFAEALPQHKIFTRDSQLWRENQYFSCIPIYSIHEESKNLKR
jgi:hypothetical protein